jgi:hypothetical protein
MLLGTALAMAAAALFRHVNTARGGLITQPTGY